MSATLLRILVGAIITALGVQMTIKAEWFYNNLGPIDFAERHLGANGGSRLFYKIIGMLIAFIGFLMITGLLGRLILFIFLPLFTGFQQTIPAP